jgi:hypothetical protein
MKAFVFASLLIASCSAHYYGAVSSQFQAQDGHGGYSYGYSDPLSSKQETKSHDGTTHGGYSYVDAHGHLQSVKYVADAHNGFQIVSATNLPKGPAPVHAAPVHYSAPAVHWGVPSYAHAHHDIPVPVHKTHEVLAAEAEHFAAHAEAKARLHHHHKRSAHWGPSHNGVPVDTPEVQHEKQIHFAAHQRALAGQPANPILYHPQLANPAPAHHNHYEPAHYHAAPAPKYDWHHNPAPAPVNGVPVDTPEVQHAKAAHFALYANAKAHAAPASHHNYEPAHYNEAPAPAYHAPAHHAPAYKPYTGPIHIPVIHNGVPEETPEVKAEKSKHFALVSAAAANAAHFNPHDDGSYRPSYEQPQHQQAYAHSEDDGSYKAEYDNEHYYH